jgi:tetratricopeptide (TPR) repeat protein
VCSFSVSYGFLTLCSSIGLEFDDVVVAFQFDRKIWDVDEKRTGSLRMCRELYVAVTRARRRVVILVEKNVDTMVNFFESLDCDLEITDPEVILQEFQKETSREEWFAKGEQMFAEEQYKYAASCFNAALDFGWSSYAQGCHLLAMRRRNEAGAFFRIAAKNFFEAGMFEKCLDSFKQLISAEQQWDDADNAIFDEALKKRPDHLDRKEMVAFALLRKSWDTIKFGDLTAYSSVFQSYRDDANLKAMIEKCSEDERSVIEESLPLVVGDFHVDDGRLAKATELFLRGGDEEAAMAATEAAISSTHHDLPRVATSWRRDEKARSKIPEGRAAISLLVTLFESPKDAAMNHANACMKKLGRQIVKLAVESAEDAGAEELYAFSRTGFETDILDALTERYSDNPIDVVHWYRERNDKERALAFATSNMKTWSNEDLLGIILKDKELRPRDLLAELTVRKVLVEASKACLSSDSFDLDFAKKASDKALSSVKLASENADEVLKVWNSRRNDGRVARFLSNTNEVSSSSAALLWLLFDDPQTAGRRYGKKCMRVFGKDIVRKAVLKKKGSDANGAYSLLRLFDKTKFEADKPSPAKQKAQAKRDNGPAKSIGGPSTPKGKLATEATKPGDQDELRVGDRIVVTGLTKKSNLYLNGQPGKIVKITDKGSYIVNLDFDKPDKKGNVQKRKLDRQKLKREEVENNDSSDDSGPPFLMQRGRDGRNNDDNSTSSDSSAAARPTKKSVPSARAPSSKNDDSDESSMPSLFQEGSNSSSDDDSSVATNDKAGGDNGSDTESMPELESKASSEESTDSDGAFPKGRQAAATKKKNSNSSVPSHVRTGKVQDVSSDESSDDSSVPPLQKRASPRGQDDSSDSTLSEVPLLLSGENSSDDSSVPELEEPRLSRNDSSDDSSEDGGVPMMTKRSRFKQRDISDDSDSNEDMPVPGLEYARGNQSSSDEDDRSSGSSKAPVLVSRPPEEDSSDGDSSPSDDDVPDLMDRDGSITTSQSRAQGQSQQPASKNAPARKKQKGKNKRKGRRGKGGKK